MILDAGGNTHHIDKMWWHKPPIKLQSSCIDIVTDTEQYFTMHLLDDMSLKHRQVDFHTFKVTDMRPDHKWIKTLTDPVPHTIEDNDEWIMSDEVRDFITGL